MKVSPKEMLNITKSMASSIYKAKKLVVAVGLPKGEATSKVYGDGTTVVTVAYWHEYGKGNNPQRSFLRVPFKAKEAAISNALVKSFKVVFEEGGDAETQLEKVGILLQNISKQAFRNNGFGTWPALKPSTIKSKGSSKPLIDTGILRGSITYEVRNAS
jgi:phage gpG-like protein